MRPFLPILALTALVTTPSLAVSMSTSQIAEVFCISRLSGDMAPVLAVLSPELGELVLKHLPEGADPATAIPWQSQPDYANTCEAVGAQGSGEEPIAVLAYGYRDADKAGYADGIVLHFIDERLRIDDIEYGIGGDTLRQRLDAMP
ncbi:MAG: hypothetical protein ABL879_02950 [Devosia sp.]